MVHKTFCRARVLASVKECAASFFPVRRLCRHCPAHRPGIPTFRMSAPNIEGGVLTTASNVLFAGGRNGQCF